MGKYLKSFNSHSEYLQYIQSNNKVLPNVSYCKDNDEVHYNPYVETRIVAKFNVEDDSNTTLIYGGMSEDISVFYSFTKIEVDGVEISLSDLNENNGTYQLSNGIHTVKYTLLDPTRINYSAFERCTNLTNIIIPNSVTRINEGAFYGCSGLTNITIPDSVTYIYDDVFYNCSNLETITSLSTTAPMIESHTFQYVKTGGILTVPTGSTGYDTWMSAEDYYLGAYNWTKVEQ